MISSQIRDARRRSWVMNITAVPTLRCSSAINCTMRAWMVTSSAVVGSSATITRGRPAKAMAISTRWHMPPES
jgi:hypothetical protein